MERSFIQYGFVIIFLGIPWNPRDKKEFHEKFLIFLQNTAGAAARAPQLLLKILMEATALFGLCRLGGVLLEKLNVLGRSHAGNITRAAQLLALGIHHHDGRNTTDAVFLRFLGFAEIGTAELKFDADGYTVHSLLELLLGKNLLLQLHAEDAPGRAREKQDDGKAGFLRLLLGTLHALAPLELHLGGLGRFSGGFLVRREVLGHGNAGNAESEHGAQCKN